MTLWVLWKMPGCELPADACVLSFLLPFDEETLQVGSRTGLLRGRELSLRTRSSALQLYREMVARIGVVSGEAGKTIRQSMTRSGWSSLWWFHPLSVRDSESDPLFGWILHTLTVQFAARENKTDRIVLVGAPKGIGAVLNGEFVVEERKQQPSLRYRDNLVGGVGARLRYFLNFIRYRVAIARSYRLPTVQSFDLVFSSFWDWSFKCDKEKREFTDRYFKRVPELLTAQGISIGRFAWLDPYYEPAQKGRALARVLAPLAISQDVVVLQAMLGVVDVTRALLDFLPLRTFRGASRNKDFSRVFIWGDLDWRPVLEPAIKRGCLGAQIPHYVLVSLATERAACRYGPRLTLSFLEHFPHARAHYAGMRRANIGAVNWAMQHAGVCHEKTFYFLHPRFEFNGEPDGCRVPVPDQVFAMGTLGRDIFAECGYAPEQVTLTGSARYDYVRFAASQRESTTHRAKGQPLRVLLACSLAVDSEIDMVEAGCDAAKGMPDVVLRLRNHPTNRVDKHPRFARWRRSVEVSDNSLESDIAWAEVILFSYSTLADEAFLQGKPVWQWLPLGFNGSALAESVKIPQFGSVAGLRDALKSFAANPEAWIPSFATRELAAERLFHPADGGAAARIAAHCAEFLKAGDTQGKQNTSHCE